MEVVRDRSALTTAVAKLPRPLGFVPTMGALHAGHHSLLETARIQSHSVVASLFVNPRQFAAGDDLVRYPRDEAADLEVFRTAGVDVAFVPAVEAMYPQGFATSVNVGAVGEVLEGEARPGHFEGVSTVVTVLLSLVRPDRAYFGQKDGQQVAVVRRLVADLGPPVEVVVLPTVREADGLALSSRNRYLSRAERAAAPILYRALRDAVEAHQQGTRDADGLRSGMRAMVNREPLATLEYVSVADSATMQELTESRDGALVSIAVRFPSARLIDCAVLGERPEGSPPSGR